MFQYWSFCKKKLSTFSNTYQFELSGVDVNKDDYDKCNIDNSIKKMDDENYVYDFDRLGSFCFISGNKDKCKEGQNFVIVVAAEVRLSPSVSKEDKEEHHTFLTRQQSKEDKKSTTLS
ncbi:hypothetical protein H5410_020829 [Solanum commersonii]|uniref:Phytocyanin domain-containing protein n=1 Tax=Solanum commersonii TaxID=4109 RepID=A0A9J5ZDF3_SOLCO|nr:hypothetical protein H5410_020829 [Solanum commersonii]